MRLFGRFAQSPLFYAAFLDPAMVEFLIGKGVNPNETDDDKITALGWAVIANNASMVQTLLAKGAQVNHVDNFGMTPCCTRRRSTSAIRPTDRGGRRRECEEQGGIDGSRSGEELSP